MFLVHLGYINTQIEGLDANIFNFHKRIFLLRVQSKQFFKKIKKKEFPIILTFFHMSCQLLQEYLLSSTWSKSIQYLHRPSLTSSSS